MSNEIKIEKGTKVIIQKSGYTRSWYLMDTIKQVTKTLIKTEKGFRFKKFRGFDGEIGIDNDGGYSPSNWCYLANHEKAMEKYYGQVYDIQKDDFKSVITGIASNLTVISQFELIEYIIKECSMAIDKERANIILANLKENGFVDISVFKEKFTNLSVMLQTMVLLGLEGYLTKIYMVQGIEFKKVNDALKEVNGDASKVYIKWLKGENYKDEYNPGN